MAAKYLTDKDTNAEVKVTLLSGTGRVQLYSILTSFSADPAAVKRVSIEDNSVEIFGWSILTGGPHLVALPSAGEAGLTLVSNTGPLEVKMEAGGASVIGDLVVCVHV